ncbi:MAG TPA: phage major capsid protein, partial [Methylophilaceae bacterium]|nr:phage major capsid protein [Methylophilaceae bacterium]
MKLTRLNIVAIGVLLCVASVSAMAGVPLIGPEHLAAGLMVPFAIGDTDMKNLQGLLEKQGKAFEEFKTANDKLLEAKAEGKAVADLQATVEKINGDLTQLGKDIAEVAKKANRPQVGNGESKLNEEQLEHRNAFLNFLRKGDISGLSDLERKALQRGSDVDGGYL